jgi:hypothetical protein
MAAQGGSTLGQVASRSAKRLQRELQELQVAPVRISVVCALKGRKGMRGSEGGSEGGTRVCAAETLRAPCHDNVQPQALSTRDSSLSTLQTAAKENQTQTKP